MDRRRLYGEIRDLAEGGYNIEFDLNKGEVEITGFEFPTGWEPRHGDLFYKIPGDYPNSVPAVYFSEGMSFRGSSRTHLHLRTGKDGYDKFCLHEFNWNPKKNTLITLTKVVVAGLNNPEAPNKALRKAGHV